MKMPSTINSNKQQEGGKPSCCVKQASGKPKRKRIATCFVIGCRTHGDAAFGNTPVEEETRRYIRPGQDFTIALKIKQLESNGEKRIEIKYSNVIGFTYSQSLMLIHHHNEKRERIEYDNGCFADCIVDDNPYIIVTSLSSQKELTQTMNWE
jgi:hypothetical protein